MAKYYSTKTFGNDRGFSCAFRQWRASSHCNQVHGYSLGFRFVFEADELDHRSWVYDFGNTAWIKSYLEELFDHTTVVADDDPLMDHFKKLDAAGGCTLRILHSVGCERFAETVYADIAPQIADETRGRVRLKSVEVFEHGANSAIYEG
jgi:6-pyruvoyltetrahydropterin/6-carboxytetrahydropterin synthase